MKNKYDNRAENQMQKVLDNMKQTAIELNKIGKYSPKKFDKIRVCIKVYRRKFKWTHKWEETYSFKNGKLYKQRWN